MFLPFLQFEENPQGESNENPRVNYTAALVPQNKSQQLLVFVWLWMADLEEWPGGAGPPPYIGWKKKKWLKEEKPTGQVKKNLPPAPSLAQSLDPPLVIVTMTNILNSLPPFPAVDWNAGTCLELHVVLFAFYTIYNVETKNKWSSISQWFTLWVMSKFIWFKKDHWKNYNYLFRELFSFYRWLVHSHS